MRAPGAVHVLRSAQASRQSRRPWPPSGHVRLHSASCAVQVLWHAAARALPRVAASDRPTVATRNSARRRDRNYVLLRPSTGVNAPAGQIGHHELLPTMVWSTARQRVPPSPPRNAGRDRVTWLVLPPVRRSGSAAGAGPPTPHIREM